jgi:hypothetical protein
MVIFNSYVKLPEGKSSVHGPFSIAAIAMFIESITLRQSTVAGYDDHHHFCR